MEMAPQALGKIESGDGNGAIRGRRTFNEGTTGIEATKGQVLAPNALKKLARGQSCTGAGRKETAGSFRGRRSVGIVISSPERLRRPDSYGARFVKGQFRIVSDAGRLLSSMGFDADVRPEGADRSVEAHGCPPPEPRAAVNPRASDRAAAARVSEAGLTASTAQAPVREWIRAPEASGAEPGRARASGVGSRRRRARRSAAQGRSKAAPLCSGRVRPASSYPAALVGSARP